MKVNLRSVVSTLVLAAAFVNAQTSAHAWSYSASGQWASVSYSDGWTVYQDEWGSSATAWLNANNSGNFGCSVNFTGGGVKNYCHTQKNCNLTLGGGHWCTSNYNNTPGSGMYDFMYDLWSGNMADEIMIYTNKTTPTGGWGRQINGSVNIGGTNYSQVWQVTNGHNIIMFYGSEGTSGTRDLYSVMNWCYQKGLLHNNLFYQVSYGVEVTSTNGWQNFNVNSFWCGWA